MFWQYAYMRATKKSCALHPFHTLPSFKEEPPIELGLCVSNVPNVPTTPNGSSFYKGSNYRNRPGSIDGSANHKGPNRHDRPNYHRESNQSNQSNRSNRSNRSNSSSTINGLTGPTSPNSPGGVFQSEFIVVPNTRCFRWRLKYLQDIELPRCVEDAFPLLLHPLVSQPLCFEPRYRCELRLCVACVSKQNERTSLW